MERFIKASSRRRNTVVPHATLGPRPRLLESSPRIGGTAWAFSARKSLCSASRQLRHSADLANVASNNGTILCQMRKQSCKSLRGTVLSRSCVLSYQAQNDKQIYSCEANDLRATQVQASSFQELRLVAVGPSKALSAGSVSHPTPSRLRSDHKHMK